jgi:hypothetical protein
VRSPPTRYDVPVPTRVAKLLAPRLLLGCAIVALVAGSADAHHIRRTALYVDFGARSVALEIRMPLEELSFARGKLVKLTNWRVDPADVRELADYVRAHLSVRSKPSGQGAADGGERQPFVLEVSDIAIETDNLLVVQAVARSQQPEPIRAIELRYDAITDRVNTHETNVCFKPCVRRSGS